MSGEGVLPAAPGIDAPGNAAAESPETLAERAACLVLMRGALARLGALQDPRGDDDDDDELPPVDPDGFHLELARLEEAIRSVELGLHRREN